MELLPNPSLLNCTFKQNGKTMKKYAYIGSALAALLVTAIIINNQKPSKSDIKATIEDFFHRASLAKCPQLFEVFDITVTRMEKFGSDNDFDIVANFKVRPTEDITVPYIDDIELAKYAKYNREISISEKNELIEKNGKTAHICNATRFEMITPILTVTKPKLIASSYSGNIIASKDSYVGGINQRFHFKRLDTGLLSTWAVVNPIMDLRPLTRSLEVYEKHQTGVIQY